MSYTKGGRGLKAPYETTHIRVPVPIKEKIQGMIDAYKESLDPNVGSDSTDKLLTRNEAIELANTILGQKKSARVSLSKLLTAIYGEDIVL
jgi:hypothetical protein